MRSLVPMLHNLGIELLNFILWHIANPFAIPVPSCQAQCLKIMLGSAVCSAGGVLVSHKPVPSF
eukprot:scaffold88639_cov17-Prasinocladus_malaysianus.AAC.1